MKQRAPMRTPGPILTCAAISLEGSTALPAATLAVACAPGCSGGSGCSSVAIRA